MFNTHQNLLSGKDLIFLDSICSNFIETETHSIKNKHNYYIRSNRSYSSNNNTFKC
jgi:hypothetical protein